MHETKLLTQGRLGPWTVKKVTVVFWGFFSAQIFSHSTQIALIIKVLLPTDLSDLSMCKLKKKIPGDHQISEIHKSAHLELKTMLWTKSVRSHFSPVLIFNVNTN